jgi:hypothetical protein
MLLVKVDSSVISLRATGAWYVLNLYPFLMYHINPLPSHISVNASLCLFISIVSLESFSKPMSAHFRSLIEVVITIILHPFKVRSDV